jgi:peptidoglycan/xylan/chitin deacetylase (PgdA/CDA1 family)
MRAIFMYHSIDDSGSPISLGARVFRQQMEFLAKGTPRVVPLADIERAPDESVALTFDDAFANFEEIAAPLMSDLGLPSTVFVVTDHVGRTNAWPNATSTLASGGAIPVLPLMTWDGVARVKQRGVEIGAHTRSHPRLTSLSDQALADEVNEPADRLAKEFGSSPESFAYPYGDVDHRVIAAARQKYARACTTELRALDRGEDCMHLPRLDAYYFRAPGQLEQWGSSAFHRRLWFRAQARRVRRFVAGAAERV